MRRFGIIVLVICIVLSQMTVYASDRGYKDESIYGLLNSQGKVESLYVVNALKGLTVDFGDYSTLENMTSLLPINQQDGQVNLPPYDAMFYYQGTLLQTDLPWSFTIDYLLDGKKVQASELAGASGLMTINLSIKKGALSKLSFFEDYALQVGLTLPNQVAANVQAQGATIVEAGAQKQIAFTVLPGNEVDFQIQADIQNFEMPSITINAVRMVFDFDVETGELTSQIEDLKTAVEKLDDGAMKLVEGANKLLSGFIQFRNGLDAFRAGILDFSQKGVQLSDGLKSIATGLSALSGQNQALNYGLDNLEASTFEQLHMQLTQGGVQLPSLNRSNYKQILGSQDLLRPALEQLEQSLMFIDGLKSYLEGVSQLSQGTNELSLGLDMYTQGSAQLAQSAEDLFKGAQGLQVGLRELRNGLGDYQEGTGEFKEATSGMSEDLDREISTMLNRFLTSPGDVVSFVSKKNIFTSSVQFFLRTPAITIEEVIENKVEEAVKETFWQRVIKLFTRFFK
jgi:putative membrane protein